MSVYLVHNRNLFSVNLPFPRCGRWQTGLNCDNEVYREPMQVSLFFFHYIVKSALFIFILFDILQRFTAKRINFYKVGNKIYLAFVILKSIDFIFKLSTIQK